MRKKKLLGVPVPTFILAIAVGVVIGSYGRFGELVPAKFSKEQFTPGVFPEDSSSSIDSSFDSELDMPAQSINSQFDKNDAKELDNIFRSSGGVILKAARKDGEFIGYEVVEGGSDQRLRSGQVIVAVNGMPAEDSAAGTEFLVAALAIHDANIVFGNADD